VIGGVARIRLTSLNLGQLLLSLLDIFHFQLLSARVSHLSQTFSIERSLILSLQYAPEISS